MAALAAAAAVVALALAATPAPSAATTDTSSTSTLTRLYGVAKTALTDYNEQGHTMHRYVDAETAASLVEDGWTVEDEVIYVPVKSDTIIYEWVYDYGDGETCNYRYATASPGSGWTKTGEYFYGADSDDSYRVKWVELYRTNEYTGVAVEEYHYASDENEIETLTQSSSVSVDYGYSETGSVFYTLGSVELTTSAGTGGSVTLAGNYTTNSSSEIRISLTGTTTATVTAGTGYTISTIKVNGTSLSSVSGTTSYTHSFVGAGAGGSVSSDQTLAATFSPITYSVVFHRNTSSSDTTTKTQSMTYDTASMLTSNTWTRTGYTFAGWATSSSSTTVTYSDGQSVKNLASTSGATIDLYAVWVPITYTVAFSANCSSYTGTMSAIAVTYDTPFTLSANAYARTGYTFAGWNTASDGSGTSYADGATVSDNLRSTSGTVTLYAQWEPITYTVAFDANEDQVPSDYDAENMPSSVSATYDVATTLPSTEPTRHGYSFAGWNTAADGSGTTYEAGSQVLNLTSTDGATVTLYAQWEPVICVSVPTVVACVVMADGEVVAPSGYQIQNLSVVDVVTTADGMVASDVAANTVTHLSLTGGSEVFNTSDGTLASFSIANESSIGLTWSVEDLDGTLNEDLLTAATQGAAAVCTVTFTFEYAG